MRRAGLPCDKWARCHRQFGPALVSIGATRDPVEPDLQSFSYRLKKLEIGLVLPDKSWRITDCDAYGEKPAGAPAGDVAGLLDP